MARSLRWLLLSMSGATARSWTGSRSTTPGGPARSSPPAQRHCRQGHALIEPYVYDVITRGRYDSDGNYRSTDTVHSYGSLTYMLYGVTDGFTAGVIPTFGFNDVRQRRRTAPASASAT